MPDIKSSEPIWDPPRHALWFQVWEDPTDASPPTVVLRHPACPFVSFLDAANESELQTCAYQYLLKANTNANLRLPDFWLQALDPASSSRAYGWVPIRSSDDGDPMASFWLEVRRKDQRLARTLVLLASQRVDKTFLRSGFGLRVIAHVRPSQRRRDEVHITGMSASLPFGPYRAPNHVTEDWDRADEKDLRRSLIGEKANVALACRLRKETVHFRGLRVGSADKETWHIEARGTGQRSDGTFHSFVLAGTTTTSNGKGVFSRPFSLLSIRPFAADVQRGKAPVFLQDPASQGDATGLRKRRPTRSEKDLGEYLKTEIITNDKGDPLQGEFIGVVQCPGFVLGDSPDGAPKRVNFGAKRAIRSNEFTAISAYRNVGQLTERLVQYGIDPPQYFRAAQLPLKVLYRSGVRPGPGKDGRTVNARVLPTGWKVDFFGPTKPDERPELEIHLALADLSHRARKLCSPAEPLGIAADQRWIWHEIGHVLLMAAVGELEFRFAHSAGDALAAIVSDPQSKLVTDRCWRGATFPWVFIPRRHDRCVLHGWSWCGTMHRPVSLAPEVARLRRKGYRSEQILSSSLFRLYRCLGGDTNESSAQTNPDRPARESASHYAVYLIIKGIGLLGYAGVVPANHPDQFVSALIDADVGTEEFTGPDSRVKRVGGCAHKVIRWAFEAQGMYAADPDKISNAPGIPESVDLYIEDRRPRSEWLAAGAVLHGPGGYVPVSLDWPNNAATSAEWHAADDAIKRKNGGIVVMVKNRGVSAAENVTVQVWSKRWSQNASSHDWNQRTGWDRCDSLTNATTIATVAGVDDQPNSGTLFGPFKEPKEPGAYIILAQASCAADRANCDPETRLPCSRLQTPIVDLVAGDNNLGLRVINIS